MAGPVLRLPSILPWLSFGGGRGGRKEFVTPTETKLHGDALCFMVKTWARHKTTETVLNSGWRLAAVGSRRLAVGGGWRLAAVGS